MFSGHLNITGLSWVVGAIGLSVWYYRIRTGSPASEMKEIWLKIIGRSSVAVGAWGLPFFWENAYFMRFAVILAPILIIWAMTAVGRGWWTLSGRSMPRWWPAFVVALGGIWIFANILNFFPLPYTAAVGGVTVYIQNVHWLVALSELPSLLISPWPFAVVLIRSGFAATDLRARLRLIMMGFAWLFGSAGSLYYALETNPHRIFAIAVFNAAVFALATVVLWVRKPSPGLPHESASETANQ